MIFRNLSLLTLVVCLVSSARCPAQQQSTENDSEIAKLQSNFDALVEEFRQHVSQVQQLGMRYFNAPHLDDAFPYYDQFDAQVVEGNAVLKKLKTAGLDLFQKRIEKSAPIDDQLTYFISKLANQFFDDGRYESAYQLSRELFKANPENKFAEIYQARSGILTNRFDEQIEQMIVANEEFFQTEDSVSQMEMLLITNMYLLRDAYQRELEIRATEAEANDLPIVELKTTQGDVEIELFENEAPEAVSNIVHLVEAKHYDGLIFHAVIAQTAAETGAFDESFRPRIIGYKIYDEKPKRAIFAGSVVMISDDKPNSSDSRFFVALGPLPGLSGARTVIGRVKNGMDAIYKLNKTHKMEEEEAVPVADAEDLQHDRILSATVTRKRDHEYLPNKVEIKK